MVVEESMKCANCSARWRVGGGRAREEPEVGGLRPGALGEEAGTEGAELEVGEGGKDERAEEGRVVGARSRWFGGRTRS
jgi:hypothetical protein